MVEVILSAIFFFFFRKESLLAEFIQVAIVMARTILAFYILRVGLPDFLYAVDIRLSVS